MLQQHVEDRTADIMDDPLVTDHSQNGKIEFHEDSDEVDTSLFSRTKAGVQTVAPVKLQQNQLHTLSSHICPVGLFMPRKCKVRQHFFLLQLLQDACHVMAADKLFD